MSLSGLRVVDDSNELPASMENWLNTGSDWTEHHGIDLCAPTAEGTVTEELFYAPPSEPVARPFLKLDALELCKESSLMGSDASSSIESNSSSHDSPATRKRSFDDLYAGPVPAVPAVPAVSAVSGPAAAMAAVVPAGVVSMVPPGAGILFPGAPLTLSSVPSMEEIAQSRPKRRNVKISTDPQSVAARHRRERISDRVRVLQHFVPGGTKMDTASMLDEAIHYVKFLQQQLQKLERLGNMSDARFMNGGAGAGAGMMMPSQAMNNISIAMHHPFDLNYCTTPYPTSMMQQSHQQQAQQAQNPLCSQSFPDHEQFCH